MPATYIYDNLQQLSSSVWKSHRAIKRNTYLQTTITANSKHTIHLNIHTRGNLVIQCDFAKCVLYSPKVQCLVSQRCLMQLLFKSRPLFCRTHLATRNPGQRPGKASCLSSELQEGIRLSEKMSKNVMFRHFQTIAIHKVLYNTFISVITHSMCVYVSVIIAKSRSYFHKDKAKCISKLIKISHQTLTMCHYFRTFSVFFFLNL